MRKIVIITGLTASGKSGLAYKIAQKYNGEIISADSVQVYKGLDIGSAKESIEIRNKIPHHLIDIKEFLDNYNVGDFVEDCKVAIEDIVSRNKLPIIVGGTGLYIKALMEGYTLGGSNSDLDFRKEYEDLAAKNGNVYVWEELNKLNPDKAKSVHPNNLKRVIRYLELELNNKTSEKAESILKEYDVCAIGIIADREIIYNKINERVDIMIKSGLKDEVKALIDGGANRDTQSTNSIGYKEWFDYYDNKTDLSKTIDLIKQHTRNYCKRQLTFLKTIKGLKLENITEAENTIGEFLNDKNQWRKFKIY